jgi:predicted dehydrogenase
MAPVKWGILGAAKIGLERVIPGMLKGSNVEVAAIASRELGKAEAATARLGIPRAYGSYEELLADPEIEAVYNPLPNNLHVAWTLRAARAGKHVLCEKPMAMDAEDARTLRACPPDRLVMEAFMVRFHPQWIRAREIVRSGRLGEVRALQMLFAYNNPDPDTIRNRLETGGGALMDIGCYAMVGARYLLDADPLRVVALIDRDPMFGTDRLSSAIMDFGGGRHLTFAVSTQAARYQRFHVLGSDARLEIAVPVNAPQGEATRILLDDGSAVDGSGAVAETVPACDQYTLQAEAFGRAIRGEETLPWGIEDSILNMRILDALFRSEKSGRWEAP